MDRATSKDEWEEWILANAAAGLSRSDVEAALVTAVGSEATENHRSLLDAAYTPALRPHLQRMIRGNAQKACVLDLLDALAPSEVERRSNVSGDDFFRAYYAASKPVVLTDVCHEWPARDRWAIDDLRDRFGDVDIFVTKGEDRRKGAFTDAKLKMSMRAFCDLLDDRCAAPANDIYLVSRNQAMRQPELQTLLDDVTIDSRYLDPARVTNHTALWVGPGGTHTPLHHDQTSVLFCQVVGTKVVRLLPPYAQDVLPHAHGFYADTIPDAVWEKALTVTLEPGDALFLPVGWWHEIRATTFSMSLTFFNFHERTNKYAWYRL